MRIAYIANIRLPTEKAHGAQIMKACEAFVRAGVELELVIPDRKTPIKEDAFSFYGVKTRFPIKRLSTPDTIGWGSFGFILQSVLFGIQASRYVAQKRAEAVYGRDEIPLAVIGLLTRQKLVWESHDGRWNMCARYLAKRAEKIVVVTKGAVGFYTAKGIPPSRLLVVPNGIDLEGFNSTESREEARRRLGLPLDKKIALYIGKLDGWKGTGTLFEAAKELPPDTAVAVIGGEEKRINELKEQYPHVLFLGARPYHELADNQAAADALILPNTGKDETSTRFTSPLKLFSYMASGKPIVASDLPSIREIVNEETAIFFEADNPGALAREIQGTLRDLPAAQEVAQRARREVEKYTWENRAAALIAALKSQETKGTDFYNEESAQYSKKRYVETPRSYLQYFYKHRLAITERYLREVAGDRQGLDLLEVGCADGVIIRAVGENFPRTFKRLVGVDIAPGMIEEAKRKNNDPRAEFYVRSGYQSSPVDVLVETGVVNYSDVEYELDTAGTYLKPDGYYILSIAGTGSLYNRLKGDVLKDFRPYRIYDRLIRERLTVVRVRGSGLFVPYIWRLPALALPIQAIFDATASVLAPGLCHEKVYLLKKK
jgi:glycosyltransferase involved in cell wall biosynthesis